MTSLKTLKAFASMLLLLLIGQSGLGQENLEPEVFSLHFTNEIVRLLDEPQGAERPETWPEWIMGISHRNGTVTEAQAWQGSPSDAGTETSFNLLIDNEALKGDLALTLAFDAEEECDFAIQIYDAEDKVVAVDLFGNVAENSVYTGTDTYIIPMDSYPSASRIAIRQVSGQLTLNGLLAFPVLGELPADAEAEMSMLNLLGGELSEESRLYQALDALIPENQRTEVTGANGAPLTREQVIKTLRAGVIRDLAKNKAEFEQRLIGTEWILDDFYKPRFARFLPEGVMHQQHVEEGSQRFSEDKPIMERGYRVLNANSVLFGIGGFMATFNDNFTEMTYETTGGRKGNARLVGRFAAGE